MPPHSAPRDTSGDGIAAPVHVSSAAPDEAEPTPDAARPSVAEVYETELSYVFRCLRALGVGPAHLDDAVQDVFIVVHKRLHEFEGRSRLRTWLYGIALRVARKYRERTTRESSRQVELEVREDAESQQTAIVEDASSLQSERLAIARAALDRLEPSKREIFVLLVVEQLSGPEAAQITGLPLGTVYSRLRAARTAFDAHVAKLSAQPPRSK